MVTATCDRGFVIYLGTEFVSKSVRLQCSLSPGAFEPVWVVLNSSAEVPACQKGCHDLSDCPEDNSCVNSEMMCFSKVVVGQLKY